MERFEKVVMLGSMYSDVFEYCGRVFDGLAEFAQASIGIISR